MRCRRYVRTTITESTASTVELVHGTGKAGSEDRSVVKISLGAATAANEKENESAEEEHADDYTCCDTTLGTSGKTTMGSERVSEGEELSRDDASGGRAESSGRERRCQGDRRGGIAGCL